MACHHITIKGRPGYLCSFGAYCFEGHLFYWYDCLGSVALREDRTPRVRMKWGFWDSMDRFANLSEEEREQYREET